MNDIVKQPVPIDILLVEDNPADVRITREAFKAAKMINVLHHVEDGIEALEFLHRKGKYVAVPRPDLVLLDLNMPKLGGLDVLAKIKADAHLKEIPVIILTTSQAEADIVESYKLHANAYVSKPVDLPKFLEVIQTFEQFWLAAVTLPPKRTT